MKRQILFFILFAFPWTPAFAFKGRYLELTSPTVTQPANMGDYGLWLKNDGGIPRLWAVDGSGAGGLLGGAGVSNHAALSGLGQDDHLQYLNAMRHMATHGAEFNNAMPISGDVNSRTTLGAHVADAETHWKQPAHTLTVAKNGTGQYATIAAALAVANASANASNPYRIEIHPGTYSESNMTVNEYVSLAAAAPLQTMIASNLPAKVFEFLGNNCIEGLWVYTTQDADLIYVNAGAGRVRFFNCCFQNTNGTDNSGKYVIKETNFGFGGKVEFTNCLLQATGGAGLVYKDSGFADLIWKFSLCTFDWTVNRTGAQYAINLTEGQDCSFDSCLFDFDSGPVSAPAQTGLYLSSNVSSARSWVQNCRFILSGTQGEELRALETGGTMTAYVHGCQFHWDAPAGAQYDLFAGPGSTVYTAASVWDSEKKEGGAGNILHLTEGDATFNTLTVNAALNGDGVSSGVLGDAFWAHGPYQRDPGSKALRSLAIGSGVPDYATTGTMGNLYVSGDVEADGGIYAEGALNVRGDAAIAGILSVSGNTIRSSTAAALTLSGANAASEGDFTVKGNHLKSSSGTPLSFSGANTTANGTLTAGGGTRAGTAKIEVAGNNTTGTGLDIRSIGTAATGEKGIDLSSSGLSTWSDYFAYCSYGNAWHADGSLDCAAVNLGSYIRTFYQTDMRFRLMNSAYNFEWWNGADTPIARLSGAGDLTLGASTDAAEVINPRAGGAAELAFGGPGEGDQFTFRGPVLLSTNATTSWDQFPATAIVRLGDAATTYSTEGAEAWIGGIEAANGALYDLPLAFKYKTITGARFSCWAAGVSGCTLSAWIKEKSAASGAKTTVLGGSSAPWTEAGGPAHHNVTVAFDDYDLAANCSYELVFKLSAASSWTRIYVCQAGVEYK